MTKLTQERLKEVLYYNPMSGVFTWISPTSRKIKQGAIAGSINKNVGYIYIRIDGSLYLAHRLAWLYETGNFPPGQLDHKDKIRTNNKFLNLRPASQSQQSSNSSLRSDNNLGYRGVWKRKNRNKYVASINYKGKRYLLGNFNSPEEAASAYDKAATSLFGEFANTNSMMRSCE